MHIQHVHRFYIMFKTVVFQHIYFMTLFIFREKGREGERERNINVRVEH